MVRIHFWHPVFWGICFFLLLGCLGFLAPAGSGAGQGPAGETPRQLDQQAESSYAPIHTYIARLVRRSLSDGKTDEQVLIIYFRKDPWSVHFKWLSGEGQGREVLYVKDHYENKLYGVTALGDIPFLPAGRKLALNLDSPLVRQASPTPVTESGLGALRRRFGRMVDAWDRGDVSKGQLKVLGEQHRPDYDVPLIMVQRTLPPKVDEDLPQGGRNLIGFHSQLHLPVLSVLYNNVGTEVGYYRFDRLELNVHLTDADFDPAKIGPQPQPDQQPKQQH